MGALQVSDGAWCIHHAHLSSISCFVSLSRSLSLFAKRGPDHIRATACFGSSYDGIALICAVLVWLSAAMFCIGD